MEREKLIRVVTAAQGGDNEALNTLFNEFYNDVYYFALKTVKDSDLACDITQETFVEIINTLDKLQEPAAFVTWMKQITWHQCTRYFKKKKDVLVDEDEEGNTIFDTLAEDKAEFIPDEALDQQDFRKTILGMIDQLSEEQRAATMLYYFDELSVKQIADIQGCSEGTVKSRLNYARKSIKASVEAYEKKNGVKLHCVGVLPLLLWLWGTSRETMSVAAAGTVAQGVTAATGTAVAVSAGTATAATATTAATGAAADAGILAKIAALPVVTKVIATVVAGVIVISGVGAAISSIEDVKISDGGSHIASEDTSSSELSDKNPSMEYIEHTVPDNCQYITNSGVIIEAGENMPSIISSGDVFITEEYTYTYSETGFAAGWGVKVNDRTQTTYAPLATRINGAPLTDMSSAFADCTNMIEAPKIPASVTQMGFAFRNCSSLVIAPTLPEGVEGLSFTFYGCSTLTVAPKIPASARAINSMFANCTSMTTAPVIPSGVNDIRDAFRNCTSLTGTVEINSEFYVHDNYCQGNCSWCAVFQWASRCHDCPECGVIDYDSCFSGVELPLTLTGSSNLLYDIAYHTGKDTVTVDHPCVMPLLDAESTIPLGCSYITADGITYHEGQPFPAQSSEGDRFVTADYTYHYMNFAQITEGQLFRPTDRTTWNPIVNDTTKENYEPIYTSINGCYVRTMRRTFADCINMVVPPAIPVYVADIVSAFENCSSMTTAPVISGRVKLMDSAFKDCTSLTGVVTIYAGEAYWYIDSSLSFDDCFRGTELPITIMGDNKSSQEIAATATNGNVSVQS